MFNRKRIKALEDEINGTPFVSGGHSIFTSVYTPNKAAVRGLTQRVKDLEEILCARIKNQENEITKLKAIVAELCDYVYSDKGETK